jgi:hypothetical protein
MSVVVIPDEAPAVGDGIGEAVVDGSTGVLAAAPSDVASGDAVPLPAAPQAVRTRVSRMAVKDLVCRMTGLLADARPRTEAGLSRERSRGC